jgi:polyisoprenoid-binding protein YceI
MSVTLVVANSMPVAMHSACLASLLAIGACGPRAPRARDAALPQSVERPSFAEEHRLTASNTEVEVDVRVLGGYMLHFKRLSGRLALAPKIQDSWLFVKVEMASGEADWKEAADIAKGPNFLDVERYPHALFDVRSIELRSDNERELVGVLELHGTRRAISVPSSIATDACRFELKSAFTLRRQDYGVVAKGTLEAIVGDDLEVRLRVRVPRKSATPECSASSTSNSTAK